MNLNGQQIGRLFIFLAGLIIFAHAAVPHHHHFELTHSFEQESTCESTAQEKNSKNPDSHCHAFNILAFGNTTNFSLNQSLSEYFSFYLHGIIDNIEIPSVNNHITTFFGHQTIFFKQFFVTAQSLRAPPSYT